MSRQSFAAPPLPVLITRPASQAGRFAAALTDRFAAQIVPVLSPLMHPVFLPVDPPPSGAVALILTSETGAKAASVLRAKLPNFAYCVGDRTAETARNLGFSTLSAGGDAEDLLALILAQPDRGPLLYLHGRDRAADLAAVLAPSGRQVMSLAVYAQEPQPLSAEALALLGQKRRVIVPLFSPRSTQLFFAAAGEIRADMVPVLISENCRKALPEKWAAAAILAKHPDAEAMLAAIACQLPPGAT